jgi:hypothetical protein
MKLRLAKLSTLSSMRGEPDRYFLTVAEVSLGRYLRGRAYHAWDMSTPSRWWGAGIERLQRRAARLGRRLEGRDGLDRLADRLTGLAETPWPCRQDIRCHLWNYDVLHELGLVELTAEQYQALGGTHGHGRRPG